MQHLHLHYWLWISGTALAAIALGREVIRGAMAARQPVRVRVERPLVPVRRSFYEQRSGFESGRAGERGNFVVL